MISQTSKMRWILLVCKDETVESEDGVAGTVIATIHRVDDRAMISLALEVERKARANMPNLRVGTSVTIRFEDSDQ